MAAGESNRFADPTPMCPRRQFVCSRRTSAVRASSRLTPFSPQQSACEQLGEGPVRLRHATRKPGKTLVGGTLRCANPLVTVAPIRDYVIERGLDACRDLWSQLGNVGVARSSVRELGQRKEVGFSRLSVAPTRANSSRTWLTDGATPSPFRLSRPAADGISHPLTLEQRRRTLDRWVEVEVF